MRAALQQIHSSMPSRFGEGRLKVSTLAYQDRLLGRGAFIDSYLGRIRELQGLLAHPGTRRLEEFL